MTTIENTYLYSLISILSEKAELNVADTHLPELIHRGLDTVLKIDGTVSTSLFLLNNETFDFEQRGSVPYSERNNLQADYNALINIGQIGKALSTTRIVAYSLNESETNLSKDLMICPMISSNGAIGVLLIKFASFDKIPYQSSFGVFELWLSQFAANIENSIFKKQLKKHSATVDQKLAAKTLTISQSKREIEAILNAVQAAILVIDPESNTIISANPIAAILVGDSQANIVGRSAFDFFRKSQESFAVDDHVKFSKNFESTIYSIRELPIPILRSTATINIGNQYLRIESFFDITDRKMNEIALRQANELLELKVEERTEDLQILVRKLQDEVLEREKAELEARKMLTKEQELNEMKSKFVSLVSHEFRTPLTIIRSAAQVLEKYHKQIQEDQILNYLSRIIFTVDNMTDLMENVLFIGKTDSQKYKFSPKPTYVKALIDGIVQDATLSSKSQNKVIIVFDTLDIEYCIDEVLIRQIMLNLITNAFKYSLENSDIEINVSFEIDSLTFSIKDLGIGIPEDEQSKIFEQFYRGSNVGIVNGTGLGMTVVLRSLKMHNGRIEVKSKINEGTIFKVIIPVIHEC